MELHPYIFSLSRVLNKETILLQDFPLLVFKFIVDHEKPLSVYWGNF